MRTGGLRVQGVATFACGVATAYRPALLARPAGLVDAQGAVEPRTPLVLRSMARRDAAVGLAMVRACLTIPVVVHGVGRQTRRVRQALAPQGPALTAAGAVRVASDVGNALFFGRALRGRCGGPGRSSGRWAGPP
ncbi:hypothetical protein ABZ733_37150 [Streptomyces longwoodensis]|uniref:hypothetical protein n=1 Tax=Streptomyces longwoodensis TaxID=68231 RepID=UPI0033F23F39